MPNLRSDTFMNKAKACRATINRLLCTTQRRQGRDTQRRETILALCTSSAAVYARIFDKRRIGTGWGLRTETLQLNATWPHCIFGERVLRQTTPSRLNGFGKQPRMVMRPLRKILPGCTSLEPVYHWITPAQPAGCKWPLRKGMRERNWTLVTSTSKE